LKKEKGSRSLHSSRKRAALSLKLRGITHLAEKKKGSFSISKKTWGQRELKSNAMLRIQVLQKEKVRHGGDPEVVPQTSNKMLDLFGILQKRRVG